MEKDLEEKFIEVEGSRVRYFSVGSGKPVLFVSGWMGTADNFIPILERLPRNLHAIAVDIPGFGKSTPLVGTPHTVANYAIFIKKLTKALKLTDPLIIGISLGASIALYYCANVDPSATKVLVQSPVYEPIKLDFKAKFYLGILYHLGPIARLIFKACQHKFFHYLVYFEAAILTRDVNMRSLDFQTVSRYGLKNLASTSVDVARESLTDVLSINLESDLPKIKSKILLIYGSNESLCPQPYHENLASHLSNCQFVIVPGGTHFLMLQKPDTFVKLMTDFIDEA